VRIVTETCTVGIKIEDEYCSRCSVCSSVCPFEAISLDEEKEKLVLDVEKCQVCGLCFSACPACAIDIVYYDLDSMISYVEKEMKETGLKTLVVMCRGGSPPPSAKTREILRQRGIESFIPLRLPCAGRVQPEFFLKALSLGIRNIVVIQCEEDYCRFKVGSKTSRLRISLLRVLLKQLGFGDVLTVIEKSMKAVYLTENCVGCGKCAFVCPYGAIELQPAGTPLIHEEACVGCGACAIACPHQAIQLEGYEYDHVSKLIHDYGSAVKEAKAKDRKPSLLIFSCQWSEFSALDKVKNGLLNENTAVIEVPCFKGLDPVHVIEALYSGFDGVLAVVCPEEKCKLEKGTEIAKQNAATLEKILEELNLREKFELHEATPVYVDQFESLLKEFSDKISRLCTRGK